MINPDVLDKVVFQDGKPLRMQVISEKTNLLSGEWYNVLQDRNGMWYFQAGDYIYEVERKKQ